MNSHAEILARSHLGSNAGLRELPSPAALPELSVPLEAFAKVRAQLMKAKGELIRAQKRWDQEIARRYSTPKVRATLRKAVETLETAIADLTAKQTAARRVLDERMQDLGPELASTRAVALQNAERDEDAALTAFIDAVKNTDQIRAGVDWLAAYPDRGYRDPGRGLSDPRLVGSQWQSVDDLADAVLRRRPRRRGGTVVGMETTVS